MTTLKTRLLLVGAMVCLSLALFSSLAAEPIELEADEVEFDTKKGKSTYRGNVVIAQGHLRLTGDVVEVFSEDGEIVRIFSRAAPTTFSDRSDKKEGPLYAEAQTIEYDIKAKRVRLRGQARLSNAKRSLRGHAIVYLLETGEMFADGGDGGRVRLTIDPDRP